MRPVQNGRHFADDIFKCNLLIEMVVFLFRIHRILSLRFQLTGNGSEIPSVVIALFVLIWGERGQLFFNFRNRSWENKANLRDLTAATGLVILLKLGSNRRLISPCDLGIWRMTSKNKAPLLYNIKICASFQIHGWIETGVIVSKRSIRVKIGAFLSRVTLKFDEWPWKTIGRLFYTTSSFVQHFKTIGIFKLELQSGSA